MLIILAALAGLRPARNSRAGWLSPLLLVGVGAIFALGLTLKWDDQPVRWNALRPLDAALWQAGHWLKPALFRDSQPPAPFDAGVPLPGMLLTAVVPYFEQGRVFARYAALASLGLALLAGLALTRLRRRWVAALVAGLLLFEVLPPPLARVPFPPPVHPAFAWLREHPLEGEAIADVAAWDQSRLVLYGRGETLWATLLHGQPTVAGASSVWAGHTVALNSWLFAHPQPFRDPEFVPTLRASRVRYLVFHMLGSGEAAILAEAAANPVVSIVGRFEPPAGRSPWPYPITIVEILPAAQ